MKKRMLFRAAVIIQLAHFISCHPGTAKPGYGISAGTAQIARGGELFMQYCSGCHNFKQSSIGPGLGGITDLVSADWIGHFIANPKKMIDAGDKRGRSLFKKYKVVMPSFDMLGINDIEAVIAFIHTQKTAVSYVTKGYGQALTNPVTDTIQLSNLLVGLKLVTQMPPTSDSGKLPLTRITKMDFEPRSVNNFMLDLRGKLYRLQGNKPTVYMDIARLRPLFTCEAGLGTGFGSFAFHPDFAKNGLLYTAHSEIAGAGEPDFSYADSIKVTLQYVLTEWKASNPAAISFAGTSRELMRINMVYVIHGIQEIAFNPVAKPGNNDYGMLYVAVGDGGVVETGYPALTHGLHNIWGTILRIDPAGHNSPNGKYGIPGDNPFIKNKDPKTLKEIFALGFKNPHRVTWTSTGRMIVCNIGEANIESVNEVMPGNDFGWPVREGSFALDPYGDITKVYALPANDSIYHFTYPVAQYDHDGGWTAISGGYEYEGKVIPELKGKFIFGDIASGRLFYLEIKDIKQGKMAPINEWKFTVDGKETTFKKIAGNDHRVDMHFGRDAQGELYILIKPDGKIYKLVNAKNSTT